MTHKEIIEALESVLNLGVGPTADTPMSECIYTYLPKKVLEEAIESKKRNDEFDARNYAQQYTIIDRQNISNGRYYGTDAQMVVLIEECAELVQAATKWLRVRQHGHQVRKTPAEVMDNMIEELADVGIMLDQICDLLNISDRELNTIREAKTKRTAEDIKLRERTYRHPFYYSAQEVPDERNEETQPGIETGEG